jgi:hypothetical protein
MAVENFNTENVKLAEFEKNNKLSVKVFDFPSDTKTPKTKIFENLPEQEVLKEPPPLVLDDSVQICLQSNFQKVEGFENSTHETAAILEDLKIAVLIIAHSSYDYLESCLISLFKCDNVDKFQFFVSLDHVESYRKMDSVGFFEKIMFLTHN